jgi:hypothetical protein
MEIHITVARPQWLRVPRSRSARVFVSAAAAIAVAVPAAWASHQFGDVPHTNPHHDDISSIRSAGITAGCNPPANTLYCPDDAVRRDQMASFLHRGLGRAAFAETEAPLALTSNYEPILTTTLTTGGVPGRTGFVVVTAAVSTLDSPAEFGTSPKLVQFRLHHAGPGGGTSSAVAAQLMPTTPSWAGVVGTAALTARFQVPTGTTRTFQLQARVGAGGPPVTASGRQMTAVYVPLGAAG